MVVEFLQLTFSRFFGNVNVGIAFPKDGRLLCLLCRLPNPEGVVACCDNPLFACALLTQKGRVKG